MLKFQAISRKKKIQLTHKDKQIVQDNGSRN
jgi:hypothetical protein